MSYGNPVTLNYSYSAQDIGNGDITKKVKPPRGATRGRVEAINLFASETFTQTTTQALVQAGVTGDLDKFAELQVGALASGASLSDEDVSNTFKLDGQFDLSEESDSDLTLTFVAPTGGTPAGIADVDIAISWFY